MNIAAMRAELRQERELLTDSIRVLERMQPRVDALTKRKPFSAETRRKMAAPQKKQWARARGSQEGLDASQ
jgi:hypothetical protein